MASTPPSSTGVKNLRSCLCVFLHCVQATLSQPKITKKDVWLFQNHDECAMAWSRPPRPWLLWTTISLSLTSSVTFASTEKQQELQLLSNNFKSPVAWGVPERFVQTSWLLRDIRVWSVLKKIKNKGKKRKKHKMCCDSSSSDSISKYKSPLAHSLNRYSWWLHSHTERPPAQGH